MAYTAITSTEVQVGQAITESLLGKVKDNFADHETRISGFSSGSKKVEVFNLDIQLGVRASTVTGILYYESIQDMTLQEAAIQIYDKGTIATGSLTIDVKKNTTPNNTGMTSVFTSAPTTNFATNANYARATGTFNATYQSILKGDILRLDITSLPVGLGAFRVILIGTV